jgi:hypothetical protein
MLIHHIECQNRDLVKHFVDRRPIDAVEDDLNFGALSWVSDGAMPNVGTNRA